MSDRDEQAPTETELQLMRIVDGTLSDATAAQLRARAEATPELHAGLAEQERGASLVRAVDVAAPDALRERLDAMLDPGPGAAPVENHRSRSRRPRARSRARWRNTLFLPAATALAIVILALVLLFGPGAGAPSVRQTATLALARATAPAPGPVSGRPDLLEAGVDGIPFPSYVGTIQWRAVGSRTQQVHKRKIVTVYYRSPDGIRVGYAIVPGPSLRTPIGASTVRHGVRYTFGSLGRNRYVTWLRSGHTCVIAGTRVTNQTLLGLATTDEQITT